MRNALKPLPSAFGVTLVMLAMVILPTALTLHTIHESALLPDVAANASPYGYTISLFLFIVPSLFIVLWLIPQEGLTISRRSLGWSVGLLFPLGHSWTSSSRDISFGFRIQRRP
jgi:hypothetical protein